MNMPVDDEEELLYVKIENDDEEVYRGYNSEFLFENLSSLEEEFLICHICNGIMREAVLTDGDATCLLCSDNVNKSNPVNKVNKTTEELAIKCPLMRKCEWVGTLNEALSHLKICPDFRVACVNCNSVLQRLDMTQHLENCPKRVLSCGFCQQKMPVLCINEHISLCQQAPVVCPNQCGVEIIRENLYAHISYDCGHRFVSCAFFKLGCTEKLIQFKDLDTHNKEMMVKHQMFLLEQVEQLGDDNEMMKLKINENFEQQDKILKMSSKMNLELKVMQTMEGIEWNIEEFIPGAEIKGPKFFIGGYKLRCYAIFTEFKRRSHVDPYKIQVYLKQKRSENEKRLTPIVLAKCTCILVNDEDKTMSKVLETNINYQLKTGTKSETVANICSNEFSVENTLHLRLYFSTGNHMMPLFESYVNKLQDVEPLKMYRTASPKSQTQNYVGNSHGNYRRTNSIFSEILTSQFNESLDTQKPISASEEHFECSQNESEDLYVTMKAINSLFDKDKTCSDV